jgi:16S rRNA (uracil1498-N3)-methyltransferase
MAGPSDIRSAPVSRLPRSLVDELQPDEIGLPAGERHHLERVLRLRVGDPLELIDGRGGLVRARWTAAGRALVERRFPVTPPDPRRLVLAVAPPRLPRLEWLVEKAVELDVAELVLLESRRAERLPGAGRRARLQRIADQALLQCGRLHRMSVGAPATLPAVLEGVADDVTIWLARPPTGGPAAPGATRPAEGPLLALVGPEGGFEEAEEQLALQAGAKPVSLGALTLRVETAAVALAVLARV